MEFKLASCNESCVMLKPCASCIIGTKQSSSSGGLAWPYWRCHCKDLGSSLPCKHEFMPKSQKKERVFFNTSSAFQCVYHRFQVYCHTLSNNLDKFPKELGGKLGIYQWIFKFQEDMELETEMTWFSKMRAVNHFALVRIHASRWELANLLKPGSDCCSPSLPPGWIAGYSVIQQTSSGKYKPFDTKRDCPQFSERVKIR